MVTNRFKLKFTLISLCLIFVTGLHPAAALVPKKLFLYSMQPDWGTRYPLCVGETRHFPFHVTPLDSEQDIAGATVSLDGKSSAPTNEAGIAMVPYKAEKAGKFYLHAVAKYKNWTPAEEGLTVTVEDCGWTIRFWYEESVSAASEGNFFEATCWMKFPDQYFHRDAQNNLVLTESSMINATYGCDPTGMDFPLYATMEPSVEGSLQIGFSGKYTEKSLLISLTAPGGVQPTDPIVNLQVVDAVQNKKVGPQIPWAMLPYIDVITQSGVGNWKTDNTMFAYKVFEAPKTLFWREPLHFSGGTAYYIVERVKNH